MSTFGDTQAQLANGVVDGFCSFILAAASIFLWLSAFDIGLFQVREPPKTIVGSRRFLHLPGTIQFAMFATICAFIASLSQTIRKLAAWDTSLSSQIWCEVVSRSFFLFYCSSKSLTLGFLGARSMTMFESFDTPNSKCFNRRFTLGFSLLFAAAELVVGLVGVAINEHGDALKNPGICTSVIASVYLWVFAGFDAISSVGLIIIFLHPLIKIAKYAQEHRQDVELENLAREYLWVGGGTAFIAFVCAMATSFSYKFSEAVQLLAAVLFVVDLTANSLMQVYGTRRFWKSKSRARLENTQALQARLVSSDGYAHYNSTELQKISSFGKDSRLLSSTAGSPQLLRFSKEKERSASRLSNISLASSSKRLIQTE
jgi:hypothetical protein